MEETLIDASPLIYFARMRRLVVLAQVVGPLAITPAVHRETVIVGRTRGFADADRIASAVADGLVVGLELTAQEIVIIERLREDPRIGPGECETIACAVARGLRALIEDKRADGSRRKRA